jgi:predicted Zn-dependent protease
MSQRLRLMLIVVVFFAAGLFVWLGDVDQKVGLDSVTEFGGSLVRDIDRSAMQLTRVSSEEEMRLGNELAAEITSSWEGDPEWSYYLRKVGESMLPFIDRQDIEYTFHVLDSEMVNAFAIPGGQVFVTTAMLEEFFDSEAELAVVLGHEMSHVDLRHCIAHYQNVLTLEKIGIGEVGALMEILRRFVAMGYDQYQEEEADAHGVYLAVQAGYDPGAAMTLFERLALESGEQAPVPARTPVGEVAGAIGDLLGSYGQTHPASLDRVTDMRGWIARQGRGIDGETFYVGREYLRLRVPRDDREYPEEWLQH